MILHRYYQRLKVGPWMWSRDKGMDEESVRLICSLAPPYFSGSVGLAHSAVSVRDHNEIGLWMCGKRGGEVLLLETGAWALSCPPRFQHEGRQRIYVAAWHIKSLPGCRQVIQNTPRKKHTIIRKKERRVMKRGYTEKWFPRTSGRCTWSNNAGAQKKVQSALAAEGLEAEWRGLLWPSLRLFSISTMQRLSDTSNQANKQTGVLS